MESTTKVRWRDKREKTRRVWSYKEEQVLISTLKEYCKIGWKSDTGVFKAGYIIALEKAMLKAFPNTDLRAAPHIESKLHVWKKSYTTVSTMLATDGFSWDNAACRIIVEKEGTLEAFFRKHPKLYDVNMTHKTFPYYKDWKDIFGKDKAAADLALGPSHAVDEMVEEEVGNEDGEAGDFKDGSAFATETPEDHEKDASKLVMAPNEDRETGDLFDGYTLITKTQSDHEKDGTNKKSKATRNEDRDFVDGSTSVTETRRDHDKTAMRQKSKKRRLFPDQITGDAASLSASLQSMTEKIEEGLGKIAQRMGYDQDVSDKRTKIYPALEKLPGFEIEDKLKAADRIARDPHRIDIFFSLPDEAKRKMVKMLLDGRM